MTANVEQTLSFITQEGVTISLRKTGNNAMAQLTLQDVDENGEAIVLHAFLHKDEERALLSMIEKI